MGRYHPGWHKNGTSPNEATQDGTQNATQDAQEGCCYSVCKSMALASFDCPGVNQLQADSVRLLKYSTTIYLS